MLGLGNRLTIAAVLTSFLLAAIFGSGRAAALVLSGDPRSLPDNVIADIARNATPEQITVPHGTLISSAIDERCGQQRDAYKTVLKEMFAQLNHGLSDMNFNVPAPHNLQIVIPYCLETEPVAVTLTTQTNDSMWKYYLYKISNPAMFSDNSVLRQIQNQKFIAEAEAATPTLTAELRPLWPTPAERQPAVASASSKFDLPNYSDALKQMSDDLFMHYSPSGKILNITHPLTRIYSIIPRSKSPESERKLIATLAAVDKSKIEISDDPAIGQMEGALSDFDLGNIHEDCKKPEDYQNIADVSFEKIMEALAFNEQLRAEPASPIPARSKARILIADTGIPSYEIFPFIKPVVQLDTVRPYKAEATDKNELFRHGTYVASVAMGGPKFAWVNSLIGSPLQVVFSRVDQPLVEGGNVRFAITLEKLGDIGTRIKRDTAISIVNLSLRFDSAISTFNDGYIKPETRVLYVVAAGNADPHLDLDRDPVWPAAYGGQDDSNVITVASLRWNGTLASFSNTSRNVVDIAAPGCSVSVLGFDSQKRAYVVADQSGTSISAPLVSFAAALIKSEDPSLDAAAIKRRIINTADIRPALADRIKNGRVLNVEKAIGLFADILEMRDGSLLKGHLHLSSETDGAAIDICPGATHLRREEIKRITKTREDNGETVLISLYKQANGKTMVIKCPENSSLGTLTFETWGPNQTSQSSEVDLDNFVDVNLAEIPYWNK